MKTVVISVLAACVLMGQTPAPDDEKFTLLIRQGRGTGEKYLSLTKSDQAFSVTGILSGLFMSPLMGAPEQGPEITTLAECTDQMTGTQLAAVVEKYVRDHPEKWNLPIAILFIHSLQSVCPSFNSAMRHEAPAASSNEKGR